MNIRWMAAVLVAVWAAALGGCAGTRSDRRAAGEGLEIRAAAYEKQEGFTRVVVPQTKEVIYVSPVIEMTEADVKSAEAVKSLAGPAVAVEFTWAGSRRLAAFTRAHLKEMMAIYSGRRLLIASPIKGEIRDGRMLIVGDFTPEQARELAKAIGGK